MGGEGWHGRGGGGTAAWEMGGWSELSKVVAWRHATSSRSSGQGSETRGKERRLGLIGRGGASAHRSSNPSRLRSFVATAQGVPHGPGAPVLMGMESLGRPDSLMRWVFVFVVCGLSLFRVAVVH
jgi:hypothetical protein